MSVPRRAGNRLVKKKKDYIPHVHFRFRPGTRKWGKSSLIATIWAFNIRRLKGLFLKTTVLLAFASAKRIEHLHAVSMDSDCIRFGPGDCSVTLRPRLENVPKSLSTPFERTETVRRQPLLLIIALTECGRPDCSLPRQCFCDFTLTVQAVFGNRSSFWVLGRCTNGQAVSKQSLSHWIVDAITEAYTTQGLENSLCTLRAIVPPSVVKMYVYSRYLLGSRWSSQNIFARFYKLDVQSLASQERSVSN